MKLRNKVHRDIIADFQNNWSLCDEGDKIVLRNISGVSKFKYSSIEKLAEEWETVEEPLLKGKLKEAFRLWCESNNIKLSDSLIYYRYANRKSELSFYKDGMSFNFELTYSLPYLSSCESYTVERLVGTE